MMRTPWDKIAFQLFVTPGDIKLLSVVRKLGSTCLILLLLPISRFVPCEINCGWYVSYGTARPANYVPPEEEIVKASPIAD